MKKIIALLSLLSTSSTVFAQDTKPFFECKVSVIGARDRSGYQKEYAESDLKIETTHGSLDYSEGFRIRWMLGNDQSGINTLVIDITDVSGSALSTPVAVGSIFIQKPTEKTEFHALNFYGRGRKFISIGSCRRN